MLASLVDAEEESSKFWPFNAVMGEIFNVYKLNYGVEK